LSEDEEWATASAAAAAAGQIKNAKKHKADLKKKRDHGNWK
jgi:hypothetical protein